MRQRLIRRYSLAFQRQVVEDLERGRFCSIEEARRHHEIPGNSTVSKWLRRHGKNHLLAKVVRVEKPDEADRIVQLRRQVEQLQRALGQTQAEKLLSEEFLKLACQQLDQDVEAFKKKCVGRRSTGRRPAGA